LLLHISPNLAGGFAANVKRSRAPGNRSRLQFEYMWMALDQIAQLLETMRARIELRSKLGHVGAQRPQVRPALLVSEIVQNLADKADWSFGLFRSDYFCIRLTSPCGSINFPATSSLPEGKTSSRKSSV